jgi:hypothetical protein
MERTRVKETIFDYPDLIWLLFLLMLLGYFLYVRKRINRTKNWIKTSGHITACEWSTQGHQVWPKIQYTFEVDGNEMIGEHLFIDTAHNNPASKYARKLAYKVAQAHKHNESIDVYYELGNPKNAVLDIKMPWKLNFIISLLLGLIFFQLVVFAVRIISAS